MKLLVLLIAVGIGAANARSVNGFDRSLVEKIVFDPNCGGTTGSTDKTLKELNAILRPVETPSRWGLVPQSIKKENPKDVFKTEEKKEEQRRTTTEAPRSENVMKTEDTADKHKKTEDRTDDCEHKRKSTEDRTQETHDGSWKPEKTEDRTEETHDGSWKPEKTEDRTQETRDGSWKPEKTKDRTVETHDGSWKPEKDNAFVGKFDDGSYKSEKPLFIHNQGFVPSTFVSTPAGTVRVETPTLIAERPFNFETVPQFVEQPALVQGSTFVQEPCVDNLKIRAPIVVQDSGLNFVAATSQVIVPQETIRPAVQNVVRSEVTPTTEVLIQETDDGLWKPERDNTFVGRFETPLFIANQGFVPSSLIPTPVGTVRVDSPAFTAERPVLVHESTLLQKPCVDDVINRVETVVHTEEIVRPTVEEVSRAFAQNIHRADKIIVGTPTETIVRPAVQDVLPGQFETFPTVINSALLKEPCDTVFNQQILY